MKTQAWGWLAAAVVAAGLNASYHDGGLRWAHHVVSEAKHNTSAVLALATGRADQFLVEAKLAAAPAQAQTPECPLSAALAEAQTAVALPAFRNFEAERVLIMSARQRARLARLEAERIRMEARLAQLRIPAAAFNPVVVQAPIFSRCPRLRVSAPRIPSVRVPAVPVVHLENSGFGSV